MVVRLFTLINLNFESATGKLKISSETNRLSYIIMPCLLSEAHIGIIPLPKTISYP